VEFKATPQSSTTRFEGPLRQYLKLIHSPLPIVNHAGNRLRFTAPHGPKTSAIAIGSGEFIDFSAFDFTRFSYVLFTNDTQQ
jgi:hypothetical protein